MKHITSTLYNWANDDSSKSQLHIYAIESEEEYNEIYDKLYEGEWKEVMEELGYYSDIIPVESIPGYEYTHYDCHLVGDFLVVTETVTLDV